MLRNSLVIAALLLVATYASSASTAPGPDRVKGDWDVSFAIAGQTADGTFSFDVDGKTLTGTVFTEHTGKGTITNGTFDNNKLSCTLKFEKHESIALKGELKDDQLSGTFATEGMTGTWT